MIYCGVALSGKAGAGKNAFADLLMAELVRAALWPVPVAFADGVKEELMRTKGMKKEDPGGRDALIAIGDGRRATDPDYWVNALAVKCGSLIPFGAVPVITDMRYPNELRWARDAGFLTVRIDATAMDRGYVLYRRGEDPTFSVSETPSEVALDEEVFDVRFWNPHGDNRFALHHYAYHVSGKLQGFVTESAA